MSFAKAEQLLDLATLVSARYQGITIDEVTDRYDVSLRTAQRMLRALEVRFPAVEIWHDDEGRKRWRLPDGQLKNLVNVSGDELAAFDMGIAHLRRASLLAEVAHLETLKDKILSMVPRNSISRIETDHDAILEAQGFVARPGPKPRSNDAIDRNIAEAIKACRHIEIFYQSYREKTPQKRTVAPYGLLSGTRRYLVALDLTSPKSAVIKTYRMDAITDVKTINQFFVRPAHFDLQEFANQSFGLYQRNEDIEDVEWRFTPEAADHARGMIFHPGQTDKVLPDGSYVVRFRAAGHVEMAWYLYQWGKHVEVIKPERLAKLVDGYRRNDFPAMP